MNTVLSVHLGATRLVPESKRPLVGFRKKGCTTCGTLYFETREQFEAHVLQMNPKPKAESSPT